MIYKRGMGRVVCFLFLSLFFLMAAEVAYSDEGYCANPSIQEPYVPCDDIIDASVCCPSDAEYYEEEGHPEDRDDCMENYFDEDEEPELCESACCFRGSARTTCNNRPKPVCYRDGGEPVDDGKDCSDTTDERCDVGCCCVEGIFQNDSEISTESYCDGQGGEYYEDITSPSECEDYCETGEEPDNGDPQDPNGDDDEDPYEEGCPDGMSTCVDDEDELTGECCCGSDVCNEGQYCCFGGLCSDVSCDQACIRDKSTGEYDDDGCLIVYRCVDGELEDEPTASEYCDIRFEICHSDEAETGDKQNCEDPYCYGNICSYDPNDNDNCMDLGYFDEDSNAWRCCDREDNLLDCNGDGDYDTCGADCGCVKNKPEINYINARPLTDEFVIDWIHEGSSSCEGLEYKIEFKEDDGGYDVLKDFHENNEKNFVHGGLGPESEYCYKVTARYDDGGEKTSVEKCHDSGHDICMNVVNTRNFCADEDWGFDDVLTVGLHCDSKNEIETQRECDTDRNERCMGPFPPRGGGDIHERGITQCVKQPSCSHCSDPFDTFPDDTSECLDKGVPCFYDYSNTSVDNFRPCEEVNSCYDYRSEFACTEQEGPFESNNKCLYRDCQWVDIDGSLGVCKEVDESYKDCQHCHESVYNRIYGACDSERCSHFGNCILREVDGKPECVSFDYALCSDFQNEDDCIGTQSLHIDVQWSGGSRVGGTHELTPSDDRAGIGLCRWDGGQCYRDADFDEIPDSVYLGPERLLDNQRPVTTITSPEKVSSLSEISFSVYDPGGSGVNEEFTYFCVEEVGEDPCYPEPQDDIEYGSSGNTVNLPDPGEGKYKVYYYSEDRAFNLEEVKSKEFEVIKSGPEIDIRYFIDKDFENFIDSAIEFEINLSKKSNCTDYFNEEKEELDGSVSSEFFQTKYDGLIDGNYFYKVVCEDELGNVEEEDVEVEINVDEFINETSPSGVIDYEPKLKLKTTGDASCEWKDKDTGDVGGFSDSWEEGDLHVYESNENMSFSSSGLKSYTVTCEVLGLDREPQTLISFVYDIEPPKTTAVYGNDPFDFSGYYTHSDLENKIYLKCEDEPASGFGCDGTYYCLDEFDHCEPDNEVDENSPVDFSGVTGDFYFCFYSEENVIDGYGGNHEDVQCEEMIIDSNPPTVEITSKIGDYESPDEPRKVYDEQIEVAGVVTDPDAEDTNTDPDNKVTIRVINETNYEEDYTIHLGSQEQFSKYVDLSPGVNEIIVVAEDRTGRSSVPIDLYADYDDDVAEKLWKVEPSNGVSVESVFDFKVQTFIEAERCRYVFGDSFGDGFGATKMDPDEVGWPLNPDFIHESELDFSGILPRVERDITVNCEFEDEDIEDVERTFRLSWDPDDPEIEEIYLVDDSGYKVEKFQDVLTITSNTQYVTMNVKTDTATICKYSDDVNDQYEDMMGFDNFLENHFSKINEVNLEVDDGEEYTYYVQCESGASSESRTEKREIHFRMDTSIEAFLSLLTPVDYVPENSFSIEIVSSDYSNDCWFIDGPLDDIDMPEFDSVDDRKFETYIEGVDNGEHRFEVECELLTSTENFWDSFYITVDTVVPGKPEIVVPEESGSPDKLWASWSVDDDDMGISGIGRYSYAIRSEEDGENDILDWKNTSSEYSEETIDNLEGGERYYWAVKAMSGAGLWGDEAVSDGTYAGTSIPGEIWLTRPEGGVATPGDLRFSIATMEEVDNCYHTTTGVREGAIPFIGGAGNNYINHPMEEDGINYLRHGLEEGVIPFYDYNEGQPFDLTVFCDLEDDGVTLSETFTLKWINNTPVIEEVSISEAHPHILHPTIIDHPLETGLVVETDQKTICKYSEEDVHYDFMEKFPGYGEEDYSYVNEVELEDLEDNKVHTYYVVCENSVENNNLKYTSKEDFDFTVNTSHPGFVILNNPESPTSSSEFTIEIEASETVSTCEIVDGTINFELDKVGEKTFESISQVSLSDGRHNFTARCEPAGSTFEDDFQIFVDTTPPGKPIIENDEETDDFTSLSASWLSRESLPEDEGIEQTEVVSYEYAIGSEKGESDITGGFKFTEEPYVDYGGLNLEEGETYHWTVRAVNEVGLKSEDAHSQVYAGEMVFHDIWKIKPTNGVAGEKYFDLSFGTQSNANCSISRNPDADSTTYGYELDTSLNDGYFVHERVSEFGIPANIFNYFKVICDFEDGRTEIKDFELMWRDQLPEIQEVTIDNSIIHYDVPTINVAVFESDITVKTDHKTLCRYSEDENENYDNMNKFPGYDEEEFSSEHSISVSYDDEEIYTYYLECENMVSKDTRTEREEFVFIVNTSLPGYIELRSPEGQTNHDSFDIEIWVSEPSWDGCEVIDGPYGSGKPIFESEDNDNQIYLTKDPVNLSQGVYNFEIECHGSDVISDAFEIIVDFDGPGKPEIVVPEESGSPDKLWASWSVDDDDMGISGIGRYSYAIRSEEDGENDILDWKNTSSEYSEETIDNLEGGERYYWAVKAMSGAGLWGDEAVSDGTYAGTSIPGEIWLTRPEGGVATPGDLRFSIATMEEVDNCYHTTTGVREGAIPFIGGAGNNYINHPMEEDGINYLRHGLEEGVIPFYDYNEGQPFDLTVFCDLEDDGVTLSETFTLKWINNTPVIEEVSISEAHPHILHPTIIDHPLETGLVVETDQKTICKYSEEDVHYDFMEKFPGYGEEDYSYVNEVELEDLEDNKVHTYYVVCENSVENNNLKYTSKEDFDFTVNTSHPGFVILNNPESPTSSSEFTIEIEASETVSTCEIVDGTINFELDKVGEKTFESISQVSLSDGRHNFTARCEPAGSTFEDDFQIFVDTTPPGKPIIENDEETDDFTSLSASWLSRESLPEDEGIEQTEVVSYEYAIGSEKGESDITGGFKFTEEPYVDYGGLNLEEGETYHWTVRAVNEVGLKSEDAHSQVYAGEMVFHDIWKIKPTNGVAGEKYFDLSFGTQSNANCSISRNPDADSTTYGYELDTSLNDGYFVHERVSEFGIPANIFNYFKVICDFEDGRTEIKDFELMWRDQLPEIQEVTIDNSIIHYDVPTINVAVFESDITVKTDHKTLCRYSEDENENYDNMNKFPGYDEEEFSSEHSISVSYDDEEIYTYYLECENMVSKDTRTEREEFVFIVNTSLPGYIELRSPEGQTNHDSFDIEIWVSEPSWDGCEVIDGPYGSGKPIFESEDNDNQIYLTKDPVNLSQGVYNFEIECHGSDVISDAFEIIVDFDGPGKPVIDSGDYIIDLKGDISASWYVPDDKVGLTDIGGYRYAIGTGKGKKDVTGGQWIHTGDRTVSVSEAVRSMNLVEGETYYWTVAAEDELGNWGEAGVCDGFHAGEVIDTDIWLEKPVGGVASEKNFQLEIGTSSNAECQYNIEDKDNNKFPMGDAKIRDDYFVHSITIDAPSRHNWFSLNVFCTFGDGFEGVETFDLRWVDSSPKIKNIDVDKTVLHGEEVLTIVTPTDFTNLIVETDQETICKYSEGETPYENMEEFPGYSENDYSKTHDAEVQVVDGRDYTYYIKCESAVDDEDLKYSSKESVYFEVDSSVDFYVELLEPERPVSDDFDVTIETFKPANECEIKVPVELGMSMDDDEGHIFSSEGKIDIGDLDGNDNYIFKVDCEVGYGFYEGIFEVLVDTESPGIPDIDSGEQSYSTDKLSASWEVEEGLSGIKKYEYAIGSELGDTDVVDWKKTDNLYASEEGLELEEGETYYWTVKAISGAGVEGSPGNCDGVYAGEIIHDDMWLENPTHGVAGSPEFDLEIGTNSNAECRMSRDVNQNDFDFMAPMDKSQRSGYYVHSREVDISFSGEDDVRVLCRFDDDSEVTDVYNLKWVGDDPKIRDIKLMDGDEEMPEPMGIPTIVDHIYVIDLVVETDQKTRCKYTTDGGTGYENMKGFPGFSDDEFSKTHTLVLDDYEDGEEYTYYIQCENKVSDDTRTERETFTFAMDTDHPGFIELVEPESPTSSDEFEIEFTTSKLSDDCSVVEGPTEVNFERQGESRSFKSGEVELEDGRHEFEVQCTSTDGPFNDIFEIFVDTTPPDKPEVDVSKSQDDPYSISASWTSDKGSGDVEQTDIVKYRYAIGTSHGGNDILDWKNQTGTHATEVIATEESGHYFWSVEAVNEVGLRSEIGSGEFFGGDKVVGDIELIEPPNKFSDEPRFTLKVGTNIRGECSYSLMRGEGPVSMAREQGSGAGVEYVHKEENMPFDTLASGVEHPVEVSCEFEGGGKASRTFYLGWKSSPPKIIDISIDEDFDYMNMPTIFEEPLETTLKVTTDDRSICRYTEDSGLDYDEWEKFDGYDVKDYSFDNEVHLDNLEDEREHTYTIVCESPVSPDFRSDEEEFTFNVDSTIFGYVVLQKPDEPVSSETFDLEIWVSEPAESCEIEDVGELSNQGDDIFSSEGAELTHGIHELSVECSVDGGTSFKDIIKIIVDTEPPGIPDIDDGEESHSLDTLKASWKTEEGISGIEEYEYAIGSEPESTDILDWKTTTRSIVSESGLNLYENETHYWMVRAKSGAGLWSDEGVSDGVYVGSTIHQKPRDICVDDDDCDSGVCDGGYCAEPTCYDGVKNQRETDVDCGGPCPPCEEGKRCEHDDDCMTGFCANGVCKVPTCDDGFQNQNETDVDCGGPNCEPCGAGKSCIVDDDCAGDKKCENGVCVTSDEGEVCYAETGPMKGELDSNCNRIPDKWKLKYPEHFNPYNKSAAHLDFNGNGKTNYQEYLDGTNPIRVEEADEGPSYWLLILLFLLIIIGLFVSIYLSYFYFYDSIPPKYRQYTDKVMLPIRRGLQEIKKELVKLKDKIMNLFSGGLAKSGVGKTQPKSAQKKTQSPGQIPKGPQSQQSTSKGSSPAQAAGSTGKDYFQNMQKQKTPKLTKEEFEDASSTKELIEKVRDRRRQEKADERKKLLAKFTEKEKKPAESKKKKLFDKVDEIFSSKKKSEKNEKKK